ncbi:MAG: hypothetical protein V4519_03885 [Patescibacteria group bacterium]
MRKYEKGFIRVVSIIVITIVAISASVYLSTKINSVNSSTSDTEGVLSSIEITDMTDLTDQQIVDALNIGLISQNRAKYQYLTQQDAQGNTIYGVAVDNGFNKIDAIYKGDLNNDKYADALVWVSSCTKGDCAYGLRLVLNNQDKTGESVENFRTPDTISGWSGGNATVLEKVVIEKGFVYITSSSFYSSGDWKSAEKLLRQIKKFQLKDKELVEVRNL